MAAGSAPADVAPGRLPAGEWQLRYREGGGPGRICVRDGQEWIQLLHRGQDCRRFRPETNGREMTVQYKCSAHGYGRTTMWRENPSLAQMSGQGTVDGRPFSFDAEARRTGRCGGR